MPGPGAPVVGREATDGSLATFSPCLPLPTSQETIDLTQREQQSDVGPSGGLRPTSGPGDARLLYPHPLQSFHTAQLLCVTDRT